MDNDTLDTIVIGGPSYFAIDVDGHRPRRARRAWSRRRASTRSRPRPKAIAALRLGRLDHETTANVGVINGGIIRNGVPDVVHRSSPSAAARTTTRPQALAEEMVAIIRAEVEAAGAQVEIEVDNLCRAVRIPEDAWTVRVAKQALATVGIEARAVFITGFTDASIYNNHGIEMAVVGIGAQNEHSTDECVAVADMEKAVAMLVEIFRLSAA